MSLAREDVIAKIKRLLRLSRSENVEEAANAARHAQRMMTKYQLELAEIGDLDDDGKRVPLRVRKGKDGLYHAKKLPFWICRLAGTLADLNHCEAIIEIYRGTQTIGVVGSDYGTSYVRYVFAYLKREITRLCREHAKAVSATRLRPVGTQWRTDFKLGATDTVLLRMKEAKEDALFDASPTALMRLDVVKRAAKDWLEENKTRPRRKPAKRKGDDQAYVHGRLAGQEIEIQSPELALGDGEGASS